MSKKISIEDADNEARGGCASDSSSATTEDRKKKTKKKENQEPPAAISPSLWTSGELNDEEETSRNANIVSAASSAPRDLASQASRKKGASRPRPSRNKKGAPSGKDLFPSPPQPPQIPSTGKSASLNSNDSDRHSRSPSPQPIQDKDDELKEMFKEEDELKNPITVGKDEAQSFRHIETHLSYFSTIPISKGVQELNLDHEISTIQTVLEESNKKL
jgi:hypothetical protein